MFSGDRSDSEYRRALSLPACYAEFGHTYRMKSKSAAIPEPDSLQATEFERFTSGLKKILSVRKSDLDLHKPIRPRTSAKRKKSTS